MTQFLIENLINFLSNKSTLTLILSFICYVIYKLISTPINRITSLEESFAVNAKGARRLAKIRQLQRTRKLGELPPVYPNGWFCVAESADVKHGQVRQVVFMGEQLVVMRGTKESGGKAFVLDAYCAHQGANLGVGGSVVNGNCLQCPFHGWVYSAETGNCVKIPYSDCTIPEKARVPTWPVVEVNQHIYVWFHCDGLAPTWQVPAVKEVESNIWSYKGRTEHEIATHIQESPENGADIPHLFHLHQLGFNLGSDLSKLTLSNMEPWSKHHWKASWEPLDAPLEHVGLMKLWHRMTWLGIDVPLTQAYLEAYQYGAGVVQMRFDFGLCGKAVVLLHLTPEEPMLQRARYVCFAGPRLPTLMARFFLAAQATQFDRDVMVWNNKQYMKQPLLVKEDSTVAKHRRWYSQFYSDNSPRLQKDGSVSNNSARLKPIYDF